LARSSRSFQITRHKLAKLQTKLEAARQLLYHAARLFEVGEDPTMIVSMCKAFCADVACEVADEVLANSRGLRLHRRVRHRAILQRHKTVEDRRGHDRSDVRDHRQENGDLTRLRLDCTPSPAIGWRKLRLTFIVPPKAARRTVQAKPGYGSTWSAATSSPENVHAVWLSTVRRRFCT
jgi:hypothetical protein